MKMAHRKNIKMSGPNWKKALPGWLYFWDEAVERFKTLTNHIKICEHSLCKVRLWKSKSRTKLERFKRLLLLLSSPLREIMWSVPLCLSRPNLALCCSKIKSIFLGGYGDRGDLHILKTTWIACFRAGHRLQGAVGDDTAECTHSWCFGQ